jgi:hypothetical protein
MAKFTLRPVKDRNLEVTREMLGFLSKLVYTDGGYLAIQFNGGRPYVTKRVWINGWVDEPVKMV